jgi:hypothetical protein
MPKLLGPNVEPSLLKLFLILLSLRLLLLPLSNQISQLNAAARSFDPNLSHESEASVLTP